MSASVLNTGIIFSVGTIATWAGIVYTFKSVGLLFRVLSKQPDVRPEKTQIALLVNTLIGAVLLTIGFVITKPFLKIGLSTFGFKVPLVWFVMPWTAWIGFALLIGAATRLIQIFMGITISEKIRHERSAGWCFAGALVMFLLYKRDPDNLINILKGGILFSIPNLLIVILLAVAAIASMVLTAHSANARGLGKTIITQLALIAGSFVFGIPFVFLLVTSFKEDIDMTSKNGIIWRPKVTETVPFISTDPAKKHYETQFDGKTIEGLVIEDKDGKVKIDIFRPIAIRGITFDTTRDKLKEVPVEAKVYTATVEGKKITGFEKESLGDGQRVLEVMSPAELKGKSYTLLAENTEPVRHYGLRFKNYPEALDYLPPEALSGLVYIKNTLILVVFGVVGTILSSSIVAYAFSRMKFPGKERLFSILLATMMLPGAVTLLPQFLIFRTLGWVDTLYPLWVPAFFGSAFNIFLLRQFFGQIPMELEDAAKIDGCSYLRTFWDIMVPQIKPALAVIAIWTFMGAWNNFMGPLIYVNSPENMPISYALQLFKGDRATEPGLLMAFTTLTVIPVIALFAFAQKYFIEGVTLSGLGGR